VARAAVAAGYVVTRRVMRYQIAPDRNLELHLQLPPINGLLAWRVRWLRLWRLDSRGQLDGKRFPPYVDLFPFVTDDKEMRILDGNWRLPLSLPILHETRLPSGGLVPVENPSYMHALRSRKLATQQR
jgi:hypothetical protein